MGREEWHFHLQLAYGNNLCKCSTLEHSFFLQNLSWPKWPVRGQIVQPLPSHSAFYTLPMCLQNDEGNWAYGHLWRIWMSFRCRFGCHSDHMGVPRNKFTVKMQTFRERRLNNFRFSNLVLLVAVSKSECFGNLCGGRRVSPQHLYGIPEPFAGSFRFRISYTWFGCRFRCRSGYRSPPKLNTLKTVEAQNAAVRRLFF